MTPTALFITSVSLALAGVMAAALVLLMRDNRRRATARVAVLTRMASANASSDWSVEEPAFLPEPEDDVSPATASPSGTPANSLFAGPARSERWNMRFGIAGAVGLVVVAVIAITLAQSTSTDAEGTDRAIEQPATSASLELVALQHAQGPDGLTVSGRVQHLPGAPLPSDLTATVFLFGPDGSFSASGRVALNSADLATPGGSSFTVTVASQGPVARYRVSFRDRTGRSLPHVDKRPGLTVAWTRE